MLIWTDSRLVFLAQPKCASTAIEGALRSSASYSSGTDPAEKHATYRRYLRDYRTCFEGIAGAPLEVVCLIREPVAWLSSWWRYRGRPALSGHPNSTAGMTFDAFVGAYLDGTPGPARIGRQSAFVAANDGTVGPDRLFAYEDLETFRAFLSTRLDRSVHLGWRNVSPRVEAVLSAGLRGRLQEALERDFSLHAEAADGATSAALMPSR